MKMPLGHLRLRRDEDARRGLREGLLRGSVIGAAVGHADALADVAGDQVVLVLLEGADGDEDLVLAERRVGRSAPGEVAPQERAVVLGGLDAVVVVVASGVGDVHRVILDLQRHPQLAHGVGDVTVLVGTPATDEADVLGRVVRVDRVSDEAVERDGEAEALRLLDDALRREELDHGLDLVDEVGDIDAVVGSVVQVRGGEGADLERAAERELGHVSSSGR